MTIHIATLVVLLIPQTPIVCRSVSAAPSVVLTNAMACKVFRLMRSNCYKINAEIFRLEIPQNPGAGRSSLEFHTPGDTGVQALVISPRANNAETVTGRHDTFVIREPPSTMSIGEV